MSICHLSVIYLYLPKPHILSQLVVAASIIEVKGGHEIQFSIPATAVSEPVTLLSPFFRHIFFIKTLALPAKFFLLHVTFSYLLTVSPLSLSRPQKCEVQVSVTFNGQNFSGKKSAITFAAGKK